LSEADLLADEIHTSAMGSELVADAIDGALGELFEISGGTAESGDTSASVDATDFASARVLPATLDQTGGRGLQQRFRLQIPYVQVGPGTPITCRLPGELVGFVVLVGPDSGVIRVESDGPAEEALLFDYFAFYRRLTTVVLERRISPGVEVTIEQTDQPVDRRATGIPIERTDEITPTLRLVGYMVLG
jgi:hypothetical protein